MRLRFIAGGIEEIIEGKSVPTKKKKKLYDHLYVDLRRVSDIKLLITNLLSKLHDVLLACGDMPSYVRVNPPTIGWVAMKDSSTMNAISYEWLGFPLSIFVGGPLPDLAI
ncbi:hypothetical protein AMTR_s00006p00239820 [Amborella trichopoda]|uniref:Uncharacterized protein n=1 Tax=Amborella trichopoda TaxID=13333 RepID=W1PDM7_AMBTC|nr:hypothetical protein AMTR_s00006p00239820 [Amborella trichopoda]